MHWFLLGVLLGGPPTYSTPEKVCHITDPRVAESSGLAPSHAVPGTYLTLNDSGNPASFFRFGLKGQVLAEYVVDRTPNLDWEGMAAVGRDVYLGDIGDNLAIRSTIQVYVVEEPSKGGKVTVSSKQTIVLKYPDGPRDAEALLVDPKDRSLWIVSKDRGGESRVYVAQTKPSREVVTLEHVGTLAIDTKGKDAGGGKMVTDGGFSPDGRFVVLRTYTGALEFDVPKQRRDWWKSKPRSVPVPGIRGGEAICYALDGKSLIMTTEGSPCPVFRVRISR